MDPNGGAYELIQPRENMERVEEDLEEEMPGHEESSQQIMA